jgi:hypothetical protein
VGRDSTHTIPLIFSRLFGGFCISGVFMPATQYAVLLRKQASSVLTAWPQVGNVNSNLDLIQIVNAGDGQTLQPGVPIAPLVNVDYTGAVHYPASNPTDGTRIGVFYSRLAPTASLAQIFADAFTNPSQLDIIQVINIGGNISYYLNYAGVATGS